MGPGSDDGTDPAADSGRADPAAVDRIVRRVRERLARRRRRLVAVRLGGLGLAAAALIVALGRWVPERPLSTPPAIVEAEVPVPAETAEASQRGRAEGALLVGRSAPEDRRPAVPAVPSPAAAARDLWNRCLGAWSVTVQALETRADALASVLAEGLPELPEGALGVLVLEVRRGRLDDLDRVEEGGADAFVEALGRAGGPGAWPLLEAALERVGPRPAAIRAAGALGDPRAVAWLRRWAMLGDRRALASVESLRGIAGPEATEALLFAAEGTRAGGELLFPELAREVQAALREREVEIVTYLAEATRQRKPLALKALFDIRSEAALASLVGALEDPGCRGLARQLLARAAERDLGPGPEAWRGWLEETRRLPKAKENL